LQEYYNDNRRISQEGLPTLFPEEPIINTPSKAYIALSGKWDEIEEQIQCLCEEMDFYCSKKLKKELKKFLDKFYTFNQLAYRYICCDTVELEAWEDEKKKIYKEYLDFRAFLKEDLFKS
ncbi:hypothetical protein COY51_01810, partial [Candidatus Desantisbacteria bacterium CG_4_10_14_0_8_um_filter_39_17]